MDAFVIHPYGDNSSQRRPTVAHPTDHHDRRRRLRQARALLGEAFDGTAQRDRRCRSSTASSASSRRSRERRRRSTRAPSRPRRSPSARRRRPRTTSRRSRSPSASRPSRACCVFLSRDERARASLAVGHPLRRRHAEDEPARASRSSLDRTTGGSITRCPGVELAGADRVSPVRHALGREARRLPRQLPLRPRLPLLGARRERRDALDEARGEAARAEVGELVQVDLGNAPAQGRERTATRSGWSTP